MDVVDVDVVDVDVVEVEEEDWVGGLCCVSSLLLLTLNKFPPSTRERFIETNFYLQLVD